MIFRSQELRQAILTRMTIKCQCPLLGAITRDTDESHYEKLCFQLISRNQNFTLLQIKISKIFKF